MKIVGYLYRGTFELVDPSRNRIIDNDHGCDNGQFQLQASLQKENVYTLVVTTLTEDATGEFLILSKGIANVTFTRLGESLRSGSAA